MFYVLSGRSGGGIRGGLGGRGELGGGQGRLGGGGGGGGGPGRLGQVGVLISRFFGSGRLPPPPPQARHQNSAFSGRGPGGSGGEKAGHERGLACTWRHSQARGAVFDQSPMAPPIVHPVKVCLAAGYSSGSRHPSKGWVRPKQAGWEFRV